LYLIFLEPTIAYDPFFGPMISGTVRPNIVDGVIVSGSWDNVFYFSAAYMVLMFFWVWITYENPSKADSKPLGKKLLEMVTDLRDVRLVILLVIFVAFWAMFMQIFITLPNWIVEWTDTSAIASFFEGKFLVGRWISEGGVKPEYLINIDALAIILLATTVGIIVAKMNILRVITVGILICALSLAALFFTAELMSGSWGVWLMILLIFTFAIGEIMSSPKVTELMGRIAPKNKIGVYQGYGFLSVAGGMLLSGWMTSWYGIFADKTQWYKDELMNLGYLKADIEELSLQKLGQMLETGGVNLAEFDQLLWTQHDPWLMWILFGGIGVVAVVAMVIYNHFVPELSAADDSVAAE